MKPYIVPLFKDSIIYSALGRNDYVDAFAIDVAKDLNIPIEKLMVSFFDVFPSWFMALMHIREAIAKMIGLKTANGIDVREQLDNFKGEVGESIALFHVLGRSETELMSGETDKHLDFRMSFLVKPKKEHQQITLATTVQYNGWLGKAYFFFVKPVHRLIVPIILKRIARKVDDL